MPPFEYLGPYRIGKTIGRGGMGTVFAAVEEKTGQRVAVKLISSHVADEQRFRRRFDDEVKTLQQLKHKNIVRLIGFGEEDGQLFYSMELVEGETLQQRIRREKKINWLTALNVAIDVCAALKHAHDFGVIHRDLKPANLLLADSGSVKLVDFGIAKIFGDSEHTMAGSVLGTADYMAPEQATGSGVTVRTDLYALGSVMYAMLTGRPPFRGKNVTEVIMSLKRDRPVPLDIVDATLPEDIVELVHQLLEKQPEDRPPTALAVMNRLKAMRAGLQKNETVMGRQSATRIADQSIASKPIDPNPSTDDPDDTRRGRRQTVDSGPRSVRPLDSGPDSPTIESNVNGNSPEDPSDSELVFDLDSPGTTRTHFQTVSESDRSHGYFQTGQVEPTSPWWGRLAVAGMLATLVLVVGFVFWTTRPPTADQLYAAAVDSDDSGAMSAFLKRFPEDPRYDEVYDLQMQSKLAGQLKRMETQDKLGVTPLHPYEEAFYAAMEGRHLHPAESREKLKRWLVVYDSPESELSPNLTRLIELAHYQRAELAGRGKQIKIDKRAQEMILEIRSLASGKDTESVRKKLTAIIESFRTMEWAGPAVKEAERQLELLDEEPTPQPAADAPIEDAPAAGAPIDDASP